MRILFVVHGMGVHGAEWFNGTRAKLNEVASRYPSFEDIPFDEQVRLVPIGYDGEFTQHLEEWSGSAEGLEAFAAENSVNLPDIIDWLRNASATERNFFWSHVVDVVLYRFFQLVTIPVRLQIMRQIVATLSAAMQDGTVVQASVLAHSLGTSVAHDALAFLGTTAFDGSEAFLVGNFRFTNVFMVANVGRILETGQKIYTSCMHPLSFKPETAYCTRYYNFRHRLDPFPAVRSFNPVGWGNGLIVEDQLDHFRDFNVHGFEHYLDHPKVHIPILNGLLGPVIGAATKQQALDNYPAIAPTHPCPAKVVDAAIRFQQIVSLIKTSDNPVQLVIAGAQFLAAAKEARDACV